MGAVAALNGPEWGLNPKPAPLNPEPSITLNAAPQNEGDQSTSRAETPLADVAGPEDEEQKQRPPECSV